jgi:hypothetical protein
MSTLSQTQAANAELALAVTYRPVAQLKPGPKNARLHGKAQIKKLARSWSPHIGKSISQDSVLQFRGQLEFQRRASAPYQNALPR